MPQGKVTINGMMINLGAVKYFNKVQRISRQCDKSYIFSKERYDYGIEFGFKGGSKQTVWWFAYDQNEKYCRSTASTLDQRNFKYEKLRSDFNISDY
jgi:6-pyruvoyl-tetrahydropterin synthase